MLRGVRGGAGLCRQHPAAIVRLVRSPAGHQPLAASRWANNSIHCTQRAAHSQAGASRGYIYMSACVDGASAASAGSNNCQAGTMLITWLGEKLWRLVVVTWYGSAACRCCSDTGVCRWPSTSPGPGAGCGEGAGAGADTVKGGGKYGGWKSDTEATTRLPGTGGSADSRSCNIEIFL